MTEHPSLQSTVMVVDDDEQLVDLYALWLDDLYAVRTARSVDEALEQLDETVAVVLLDRRMPGLSGDQVLDRMRERNPPAKVVMVTAVVPDFDVIEMGFDDYLVKPVSKDELLDAIDRMLARTEHDHLVQELASLSAKRAMLRA